jgi:hypothetical protein
MGVNIDEAGSYQHSAGIDLTWAAFFDLAHRHEAIARDADIGDQWLAAGSVNHPSIADDQIGNRPHRPFRPARARRPLAER